MNSEKGQPIQIEMLSAFVADRCRSDRDYRESLHKDSKAALASAGVTISDKITRVEIVENTADMVHVALPVYKMPKMADTITDEELQSLSGGEVAVSVAIIIAGAVGIVAGVAVLGTAFGVGAAILTGAIDIHGNSGSGGVSSGADTI